MSTEPMTPAQRRAARDEAGQAKQARNRRLAANIAAGTDLLVDRIDDVITFVRQMAAAHLDVPGPRAAQLADGIDSLRTALAQRDTTIAAVRELADDLPDLLQAYAWSHQEGTWLGYSEFVAGKLRAALSAPVEASATEPALTPCQCLRSHAYISPTHRGHCCFLPAGSTCHPTEVREWQQRHAQLAEAGAPAEPTGDTEPDWPAIFAQHIADEAFRDAFYQAEREYDDARCPCGGDRWVDDENWSPEDYGIGRTPARTPGAGRIPCGFCNHGGWNVDDGAELRAQATALAGSGPSQPTPTEEPTDA